MLHFKLLTNLLTFPLTYRQKNYKKRYIVRVGGCFFLTNQVCFFPRLVELNAYER